MPHARFAAWIGSLSPHIAAACAYPARGTARHLDSDVVPAARREALQRVAQHIAAAELLQDVAEPPTMSPVR